MAVRIGDTLKQINNADFPIVEAMDVAFESGDTLQELYDSGALSGGGGASYITLSQEEYDVLSDEEKVNGSEYRTYDTGHIYKLGIEYGKDGVQISDNETVEDKTWSSSKIAEEVTGAIDTINTSLANYSIPLNLYMGINHYLAIKINIHNMNYSFNMSDRSGNIYEGAFFSYNGSFSIQITKVNNSSTKNGYILGFRQYKVSDSEIYLVAKVSDYNYINGVINTPSILKSNIEILVNDDSTLWDKGTDIVVKELATMDKVKDGYAKIIKNNDTDINDAMFIAYKNSNLFGIRIYKDDNSEHELRFSASGISYVKDGVTVWTK